MIARERLSADDVESITALSDATGVALVLHPPADKLRPRTPYDSKFSLPYCLATLLVRGRVDVGSFRADAIGDPAVLELAARVEYEERAYAAAPDAFPGGVRVRTRDGRVLEAELRNQRGGAENPMSQAEVIGKFRANAAQVLDANAVAQLETAILELESQPSLAGLRLLSQAEQR